MKLLGIVMVTEISTRHGRVLDIRFNELGERRPEEFVANLMTQYGRRLDEIVVRDDEVFVYLAQNDPEMEMATSMERRAKMAESVS